MNPNILFNRRGLVDCRVFVLLRKNSFSHRTPPQLTSDCCLLMKIECSDATIHLIVVYWRQWKFTDHCYRQAVGRTEGSKAEHDVIHNPQPRCSGKVLQPQSGLIAITTSGGLWDWRTRRWRRKRPMAEEATTEELPENRRKNTAKAGGGMEL